MQLTVIFASKKLFSFMGSHLLVVDISTCNVGVIFRRLSSMAAYSELFTSSNLSVSVYLLLF